MMARATAEWLDGLRVSERGTGWVSPCPACGRERRNATTPSEKRGAVGITRDGHGWTCFPCEASGDALDLVAHKLGGKRFRELGDSYKAEVRAWCVDFLGLDTSAPRAIAAGQARTAAKVARVAELEPERRAEPVYPPAEELAALWAACVPVTADAEASAYLTGRGLDPVRVADLDAARTLPLEAPGLPTWASSWASRRMRLVVPLVDAHGAMRSVLARTVIPSAELPADALKSAAPKGYGRAGLVLACPFARRVLEHGAKPSWWADDAPVFRVVVAEGEIDFLTCAADASHAPAVLGVTAGSWTAELAARIPDGALVVVATDDDKGGEAYARRIVDTLAPRMRAGRVSVERWRPRA